MTTRPPGAARAVVLALTVLSACIRPVLAEAQSQAVDGVVIGLVRDPSQSAVGGARVDIRHEETGLTRSGQTGTDGRALFPALPPGVYVLSVTVVGFETARRDGIALRPGETVIVDVKLALAGQREEVTVSGGDRLRPAGIDAGRALGSAEALALPSLLRNPLNATLLTTGVTGTEADELNQPRINANGAQMRNSYQIDGNTNTQRDRAGLRLVTTSPVMIGELKVTTAGFAPEFGQMSGVVINMVTPSGSNQVSGLAHVSLLPAAFVARSPLAPAGTPSPPAYSRSLSLAVGGPIRRDRAHVYAAYEQIFRDASTGVITIAPANAARLGLTLPTSGWFDPGQREHFLIGKIDWQAGPRHRVSARSLGFINPSPFVGPGGLTAESRAVDLFARMASTAVQVVSTPAASVLNELRVQVASRLTTRERSPFSGTGPAVDIAGVANIGGPVAAVQGAGSRFVQRSYQILNNITRLWGAHMLKAGVDVQWIDDTRVNTARRLYTFSTIDAYLEAASGANRFGYATYIEDSGDMTIQYRTRFLSGFVQDAFPLGTRVNVLAGIRYDMFGLPRSPGLSVNAPVDRNNVAPRFGAAARLDDHGRTVLRAYGGLLYDPPPLQLFQDALTNGPQARSMTTTLSSTSPGAPPFPDVIGERPPGSSLAVPSIITVSPSFETSGVWQTSLQLDQALGRSVVVGASYIQTRGRSLAVLMDRNLLATGPVLRDGRPVFSTAVSPATRRDPAYDHVDVAESIGRSRYHAVSLTGRFSWPNIGTVNAGYLWSHARDNAPLTNAYVQGSQDDRASDPTDLDRDFGPTPFDQPHTLTIDGTFVASRQARSWRWVQPLHLGFVFKATSGLPVNVRSNRDLNRDGRLNDRPLGIGRNSRSTGAIIYLDLKAQYALWAEQTRTLTAFVAVKNLLNRTNVSSVTRVVATDLEGALIEPLPATLPVASVSATRRAEVGLTFRF